MFQSVQVWNRLFPEPRTRFPFEFDTWSLIQKSARPWFSCASTPSFQVYGKNVWIPCPMSPLFRIRTDLVSKAKHSKTSESRWISTHWCRSDAVQTNPRFSPARSSLHLPQSLEYKSLVLRISASVERQRAIDCTFSWSNFSTCIKWEYKLIWCTKPN